MKITDHVRALYSFDGSNGLEARGAEYEACLEFLADKRIQHFIEVGSAWGASFHLWSMVIAGKKISVDLPANTTDYPFMSQEALDHRRLMWDKYFTNIYEVFGDSKNPETTDEVSQILGPTKVGFLYIDADHTYESVKSDFGMFKRFVTPGGYIGLHDIFCDGHPGVKKFWNELKELYSDRFIEFFENTDGIGLIQIP